MTRIVLRLSLLAVLAVSTSACITRTVREPVFKRGPVEVFLRGDKKGGEFIDRGFDHPASVAPVRMAHILSRVDLRMDAKKGLERQPAIGLDMLYAVADGVSKGLEKAGPGQEVCVMLLVSQKRWGVFAHDYLTNFLVYMQDDVLYLHMTRWDWEVPVRREKRLPEPHVGKHPMKFVLLPSPGMSVVNQQAVAVHWRDEVFRRPSRTRITPGGRVVRKTILMESLEEDADVSTPGTRQELPEKLSAQALRELAELEEAREKGDISESEYYIKRRDIISADSESP